ncbi:MAG: DegT/DnrJ/EryC1/StrS aminotransferase family protein [Candidatus Taylorbacteria bacterium]|nr:DegT/DnrJ/EryC1/StrS aminotransferase family protein [Candidatus Taylorbacteria bacterium]
MIPLVKNVFFKEKGTKKKLCRFIEKTDALSFGKECEKFENSFALWQNRKHAVFFNSGSSANLAILQTLLNLGTIKRGDSVAFSALTWATNVMPIIELGLKAIPVDVEIETLNVSSRTFKSATEKNPIRVLFITHLLGFCGDMEKIQSYCKEKNILILEDTCEALGTVYKGKKLGNFGLASTFSFFAAHHLSTIEGGAVCTDDPKLARMLKIVRAHGWDRNLGEDGQKKIRKEFGVSDSLYAKYTFYDLGYNLRPTEISGFLGNAQLSHLNTIVKKRESNFKKFAEAIYTRTDLYYPIQSNHLDVISNFAFPIICKTKEIRDSIIEACNKKVEIRPIVGGDMTKQPFFKKYMKGSQIINSTSSLIHEQGIYFGNNPDLSNSDIKILISIFSHDYKKN